MAFQYEILPLEQRRELGYSTRTIDYERNLCLIYRYATGRGKKKYLDFYCGDEHYELNAMEEIRRVEEQKPEYDICFYVKFWGEQRLSEAKRNELRGLITEAFQHSGNFSRYKDLRTITVEFV